MIRAGTLDRRIEIVTQAATDDYAVGDFNIHVNNAAYVTYATLWASVRDVSSSETFKGDRTTSERSIAFIIRTIPGVTEKHFVRYYGEIYRIERIEEMGRREGLMIVATKVAK
jgi:SPP1 family predicted phage head-tail adaptor